MMEFWVLVWLVANPWNSGSFNGTRLERYQQDGKIAHFEVYKSTPEVMDKWRTLSTEEKATARIFNGNERKVTERIIEEVLTPGPLLKCESNCRPYGTYCSVNSPICWIELIGDGLKLQFCYKHKDHGRRFHGVE